MTKTLFYFHFYSVPDIDVCQGSNISLTCPTGTTIKLDPSRMFFGIDDVSRCENEAPTDFTSPLTYAHTFKEGNFLCERPEFYAAVSLKQLMNSSVKNSQFHGNYTRIFADIF